MNRPSSASAGVQFVGGSSRLSVDGTFAIERGSSIRCSSGPCAPGRHPAYDLFDGPLPDPLAYLQPPSGAGLSMRTCNQCSSMQPGIYASEVELKGNAHVTMAPGVYILRKGISIAGNPTLTGNGVLLYNGCERERPTSCSANGGAVSLGGNGSLSLSPLDAAHPQYGSYPNVLIFQARNNPSAITISGNSTTRSLTGLIYAPGSGGVAIGAGSGGLSIGWVVGTNLSVSGNGTVKVGEPPEQGP